MSAHPFAELPSQEILLDIINTQTEIVKAGLDLGEVMTRVCIKTQELTKAAGAVVELVEDDEMVYRAVTGITQLQLGLRLPRKGSLSGLCVEQHKILYCEDSQNDPRVDQAACRQVGLRSMIAVPLNFLHETVGVMKVISAQPNGFTKMDIQVLALMADLIGATMYHATHTTTQAMQELYHRATHDSLTGLANRSLFFDRLRKTLLVAERQKNHIAVLVVDMDNLKSINDTRGHRVGDTCIQELANRMLQTTRRADTVARLGGDEFAIILCPVESRDATKHQIKRLQEAIDAPFQLDGSTLPLSASIGLALYPDDSTEPHVLFEKADISMYYNKHKRKTA